jgi:hypothetical protein
VSFINIILFYYITPSGYWVHQRWERHAGSFHTRHVDVHAQWYVHGSTGTGWVGSVLHARLLGPILWTSDAISLQRAHHHVWFRLQLVLVGLPDEWHLHWHRCQQRRVHVSVLFVLARGAWAAFVTQCSWM